MSGPGDSSFHVCGDAAGFLPFDPAQRFAGRVEDYLRYRPRYPAPAAEDLRDACGLPPDALVADIGSGTGMLAGIFLGIGCRIIAVEPNGEMRAAGEKIQGHDPRFRAVAGWAEATGLPDGCADLVVAGQAFHWFDPAAARREFLRILKPGGWVALIWNDRERAFSPFDRDYEFLLLRHGNDYRRIGRLRPSREKLAAWFRPAEMHERLYRNRQEFDEKGLRGRLLSSSYVPNSGQSGFIPMMARLGAIFRRHQEDGRVSMAYRTSMYFGRLAGAEAGGSG